MLANRVVLGVEADDSVSSFLNYFGNRIGNTVPALQGTALYSDNIFASGTVRGRIGYAPGNWLYYATGGFAWTSENYLLAPSTDLLSSNARAGRRELVLKDRSCPIGLLRPSTCTPATAIIDP